MARNHNYYYFYLHGYGRSCNLSCLDPFYSYHLIPEGSKNISSELESNPGPLASQATALISNSLMGLDKRPPCLRLPRGSTISQHIRELLSIGAYVKLSRVFDMIRNLLSLWGKAKQDKGVSDYLINCNYVIMSQLIMPRCQGQTRKLHVSSILSCIQKIKKASYPNSYKRKLAQFWGFSPMRNSAYDRSLTSRALLRT